MLRGKSEMPAIANSLSLSSILSSSMLWICFVFKGSCIQLFFIRCTFTLTDNPPKITQHPESTSVATGAPAVFTVEATGDNLQFQWQKNGKDIDQDKSRLYCSHTDIISTLRIECVEKNDKGHYSCFINSPVEKSGIISHEAELNVCEFFCICMCGADYEFLIQFCGLGILYDAYTLIHKTPCTQQQVTTGGKQLISSHLCWCCLEL